MKLSLLCTESVLIAQLICDGYGRTWSFGYPAANVDPSPNIWRLGDFTHPTTGNTLVAGINRNYLDNDQAKRLAYFAPQILKSKNLKQRYWTGRKLLPDVFNKFYRTYRKDYIDSVETGTMRFEKEPPPEPGVEPVQPPDQPVKPETPPEQEKPSLKKGMAPKAKLPPAQVQKQTEKERAKQTVTTQRAEKMARRIDQRTKDLYDQPEVPPPPEEISPLPTEPPEETQSDQMGQQVLEPEPAQLEPEQEEMPELPPKLPPELPSEEEQEEPPPEGLR